jgi:hypothetical protein
MMKDEEGEERQNDNDGGGLVKARTGDPLRNRAASTCLA